MIETIYLAIIAALPAVAAIFGIIASVVKMTRSNDSLGGKVIESIEEFAIQLKNTKEMDEMKAAILALSQSNRALQNRCDELLTEITKIRHGEQKEE